ncbi:hypothetical protein ATCC90586_011071 [Pythium insidiosum]|nr:hypothetical protein ATCC90586_011071 [Pythium insidiosum]
MAYRKFKNACRTVIPLGRIDYRWKDGPDDMEKVKCFAYHDMSYYEDKPSKSDRQKPLSHTERYKIAVQATQVISSELADIEDGPEFYEYLQFVLDQWRNVRQQKRKRVVTPDAGEVEIEHDGMEIENNPSSEITESLHEPDSEPEQQRRRQSVNKPAKLCNEGLAFVEWIRIEGAPSVKASDQVHVLCMANQIAYMYPVSYGAWFNDAIIRTFCSRLTSYYAGSAYAGIVRAKSSSQRGAKRCIPDEIVTQVKAQVESGAFLFIVVNFSNTHWGCIIVKTGCKTIGFYDPLGKTCYQTPLEELSWELSRKGLEGYRVVALNSPVQFDGHSCGFFVCHKLWTQVDENVSDNQLLHGGIARRMAFLYFLLHGKKFEDNLFHMV